MNDEYIINKIEEHERAIEKNKELMDSIMRYLVSNGQDKLAFELVDVFSAADMFHENIIGEYKTLLEEKNK